MVLRISKKQDITVNIRSSLLVFETSLKFTKNITEIEMQLYDVKRSKIDIENENTIVTLSRPKENFLFGGLLDKISANTEKNSAILFEISIKDTDCCPTD